jgi:hypothetical protein
MQNKYETIYFNVNTDRRLDGVIGSAFPHLKPHVRADHINNRVLKNIKPEQLIILMEVVGVMSVSIKKFCSKYHLLCKDVPYNNSNGAFSFLVISLREQATANVTAFPLTKSGRSYVDAQRPVAPKPGETPSPQFLEYKNEILGDNFDKMAICVDLGHVHIYAVHMGLSNDTRLNQSKKLVEIINFHSVSKGIPFICGGDFNSFDQTRVDKNVFMKQIDIIRSLSDINWLTNDILCTFNAYPYDILFKCSGDEIQIYKSLEKQETVNEFASFCNDLVAKYGVDGGALDHIFSSKSLTCSVDVVNMGTISDHFLLKVEYSI